MLFLGILFNFHPVCHFDKGDPSDSEQAKQISASSSAQKSPIFVETCGDPSFLGMTKMRENYIFNFGKSSSNKPHLLRNWLLHCELVLRHENVLR